MTAPPREPVAWGQTRYICDRDGRPIGSDDPILSWGAEPPEDSGWWPLYAAPAPSADAAQPAEPTATDAPCSSCGQTAGFHTLRCRDKNAASELRATHCSNEGLHDSAADLIERQAREIERWRNVTARADPDDCAAGIKELYGRWKDAEAEIHKANIDSANMMAECSDLSVDVEKYRQEIAALRLAVKDDAQWAQENERLTRELDRVKVQLTSEITAAIAERDALRECVRELVACADESDSLAAERLYGKPHTPEYKTRELDHRQRSIEAWKAARAKVQA